MELKKLGCKSQSAELADCIKHATRSIRIIILRCFVMSRFIFMKDFNHWDPILVMKIHVFNLTR